MEKTLVKLSDGSFRLIIQKSLYGSDSVLKAAHKFTSQCYINVDLLSDDEIAVFFKQKEGGNNILEHTIDDFCNELVDQEVRSIVQRECGQIRDQIVKKAFSAIGENR